MPVNFFDTNVLIYLASPDDDKRLRAREIVEDGGTISVQVLNEMVNVLRRKMRLDWTAVTEVVASVRKLVDVVPLTVETHELGLDVAKRYGLSIYDCMIVASALHQGCDTLWSEDMQHGFSVNGVLRIANPFRSAAP